MTLSFSCEQGEHDHCLRPTCTCYCGHAARKARHARYDHEMPPEREHDLPVERTLRVDQRPDLDVDLLVEAYTVERLSIEAVADRYATTASAVRRRLVNAGVTIRSRGRQRGR